MDVTSWEEDEFYIELRRQILLLTADEDEDEDGFLDVRGYSRAFHGSNARQLPRGFDVIKKIHAGKGLTLQVDVPRNVNGTGVFIPTAGISRRGGHPGRNNQRKGAYKQVARTFDSSFTAGLKCSSAKC
ncbi:hypothetical protein MLD38_004394 [Melastoma candidum]|uniref:Uncharacterized protein n=1 Tax=Melastoma candidum TaxID=119954 RepID=A0ACB9SA75_9MYRT|nr:hypothetical protein MLD38_004394 [Melastoma candidum]